MEYRYEHSPFLTYQGVERLSSLLDGLVECLRRRVAVGTENLVLGTEQALYLSLETESTRIPTSELTDGTHELFKPVSITE